MTASFRHFGSFSSKTKSFGALACGLQVTIMCTLHYSS